jgi:hypothetical protein
MSKELEAVEERLEKLVPLEQEALAAEILANWQIVKGETAPAAPAAFSPSFGATRAASPRSCWFASRSLGSAFAGAIAGAAAMFLGMAFFTSPKVEIREIVREVRVQAEPPETERAESASVNRSFEQPKANRKLEDRLALSADSFRDLDALLAERSALARQMARYESNIGSASSGFVPPRISPEKYRELLRELKL